MARIPTLEYETANDEERSLLEQITERYGRATNMKRTLARSQPALDALMGWYPLHDAVLVFLGERLTALFCHAISNRNECLVCTTYFRRLLIDAGEDPAQPTLDERELAVVSFGSMLAADSQHISDEIYGRLATHFTAEQIVTLTAFGAMMVATNIVNNALAVDLDEYLASYRVHEVPGITAV